MNENQLLVIIGSVILFFLIVTAIAALRARDLMTSTILFGIFSFLMAMQYLILGGPDVAITEAAVGAGISTILFVMAIAHVGVEEKKFKSSRFLPLLMVGLVMVGLIYATFDMFAFGDPNAPAATYLSPYYITQSAADIGIPNIVTSILASYRGFDTFGETVVIFTAAISVIALLLNVKKGKS